MKVIIVEDEAAAQKILQYMLENFFDNIKIVATAVGVKDAYSAINFHNPDLVFLDIKLSDGTAFDLLQKFNDINFGIIFTTAYNEFAIKAFKYSTIDYLLKPINPMELQSAVKRAIQLKKDKDKYRELLDLLNSYTSKQQKKLILNTTKGKCMFSEEDIVRLVADGSYTTFILKNKKITVSKNIRHYEKILGNEQFIRTHQSHLVNIKHIISLEPSGKIIMSNGDKVPVSVRKRPIIKSLFKNK